AAEKAAEKVAAEKEKAAAVKAAAAARPGWPSVGDRWIYEARDADHPEKKYQIQVEVESASPSGIRDVFRPAGGPAVTLTHRSGTSLTGVAPGVASFAPYLQAFQQLHGGEEWPSLELKSLWQCSGSLECSASARAEGTERVTVPAGTFQARKVVVKLFLSGY